MAQKEKKYRPKMKALSTTHIQKVSTDVASIRNLSPGRLFRSKSTAGRLLTSKLISCQKIYSCDHIHVIEHWRRRVEGVWLVVFGFSRFIVELFFASKAYGISIVFIFRNIHTHTGYYKKCSLYEVWLKISLAT